MNLPAEPSEVAVKFVPTSAPEIVNMELEKKAIHLTMKTGIPTILVGHTGIAKTRVIQYAHQKMGWPYRSVGGRESIEVDNLLGKWRVGEGRKMEFHLGILPFCMKHGIALGLQEINYIPPEVLVLIHEYVDEGSVTIDELSPEDEDFLITPHPNFRLYGTMNPPELYPGARELSPALVRRCMVKTVEPLKKEEEMTVIMSQVTSVKSAVAKQMVEVAHSIRTQFDNNQGLFWLSTADLVMWGKICEHMPPIQAAELAVIGKAPENEVSFVRGRVRLAFDPKTAKSAVSEPTSY